MKKKKTKTISYSKWAYIFIAPFFIVYFIFTMYPTLQTFYNSFFENYREGLTIVGPNFVGLKNYKAIFSLNAAGDIGILKYFWNTMVMWVIGAVPQMLVAMILALFFTSTRLNLKFQGFFKAVIYMPNLIMASAFAMLMFALTSKVGPINQLMLQWGWIDTAFDFSSTIVSARGIIAFMNFIIWFGNTTILLMAGIMGIDEALFESARIDGASSKRVFFDITLPLLIPQLAYVFITSMIGGIQMFDVPFIYSKGSGHPDRTTMTVIMQLNNYLGTSKNYGMSGAISVILFIITGLLSIFVYKQTMSRYKK